MREEHEQIVAMTITMWRPSIGDSFRPLFRFLPYLFNRPLHQPALRPHPYASVVFEVCWNITKTTTARTHSKRNNMHYSIRTLLHLLLDERCSSTVSAHETAVITPPQPTYECILQQARHPQSHGRTRQAEGLFFLVGADSLFFTCLP